MEATPLPKPSSPTAAPARAGNVSGGNLFVVDPGFLT
jgi:hypothetical protein